MDFSYTELKELKEINITMKILRADNFPLILSFLYLVFKKNNKVILQGEDLTYSLTDYLYQLKSSQENYTDSAKNYLEKWTNDGFLRKYYISSDDNPVFELTPYTEKAIDWIRSLERREFIGTESRLLRIYESLKKIVYNTTENTEQRIAELKKQKDAIELEISNLENGNILMLSETQIKEYYMEAKETSTKLLSDFKEVEYNFRELNKAVKEKQLNAGNQKGKVLDDIFSIEENIWTSDQGRSFKAFWEFLMNSYKQEELENLIEAALALDELKDTTEQDFMRRLKNHLTEAGDKVNKTTHLLSEQLRKFLEEKNLIENKRIKEIIDEIKSLAREVKDNFPTDKSFMTVVDKPILEMVMERPLWERENKMEFESIRYEEGDGSQINSDILHKQFYVDPEELRAKIKEALKTSIQITLSDLTNLFPIQRGLNELVTYFAIATSKKVKVIINEEIKEVVTVKNKETNKLFSIEIPRIIFTR